MEAATNGEDEALMLNTEGEVAEAASSNLFWIDKEIVCTPPLTSGIRPGVTRAVVLEICQRLALPARERRIFPDAFRQAEGVFLTLSSLGVVEAVRLDGQPCDNRP
jgi:branched-subunit amino acid aminotransferase/4-amino-4-deoxychorismate lyase